jgi:hypothetical protein
MFCPIAMSNLRYILDAVPDCYVVISSTWRVYGYDYCRQVLNGNGLDVSRVIGYTPTHCEDVLGKIVRTDAVRGHQIQAWLNTYAKTPTYGQVERIAILDDDSDMGHLKRYLFKTDTAHGLQLATAEDVSAWLKGGDSSKLRYTGKE